VIFELFFNFRDFFAPEGLLTTNSHTLPCMPQDVPGLEDCRSYMGQKQHYTLQDLLVVQYILNDGILMRQRHNCSDEYHVDISEDLSMQPSQGQQ